MIGPAVMALEHIGSSTTDIAGLDVAIKYSAGHHGSLLTSANNSGNTNVVFTTETWLEIQNNVASYLASSGQQVTLTDTSVIKAP